MICDLDKQLAIAKATHQIAQAMSQRLSSSYEIYSVLEAIGLEVES